MALANPAHRQEADTCLSRALALAPPARSGRTPPPTPQPPRPPSAPRQCGRPAPHGWGGLLRDLPNPSPVSAIQLACHLFDGVPLLAPREDAEFDLQQPS
jgi:hypothetical protein